MLLSIIIPVYNEQDTIEEVMKKVHGITLICKKEIILINDGSTDKTKQKIASCTPRSVRVIHHPTNAGKGAAIQTGIRYARGDYILIQDADLEYNPEEIPKLLEPIMHHLSESKPTPIAVYGSRFSEGKAILPFLYRLGNWGLTTLTNICYGTRLTDMETGYKLLPSSFAKSMNFRSQRFDIEPEITATLIKKNIPIVEVPITYQGRSHVAGKKITARDAISAIWTIIRLRWQ